MLKDYQKEYIDNIKEIKKIWGKIYDLENQSFSNWYEGIQEVKNRTEELGEKNTRLLREFLFSNLDNVYELDEEEINNLREFSKELKTGVEDIDYGLDVVIHQTLLSYYRRKKDTENIIEELYHLGIAYFYFSKNLNDYIDRDDNEYMYKAYLVFSEGGFIY
ncbi:MAG: hypothetical protein Q4D13_02475 [Erysipelotrichaceae bacterium]|nr:hypothetical protein [Erysipelotrichaceae bacterium]